MVYEDYKFYLGTIASATQILQFFSGISVCRKFMRKGSSDDVSAFPFISGFLTCGLWTGYSKFLEDFVLTYINAFGTFIMFFYICIYYAYSSERGKLLKKLLLVSGILVLVRTHIKSIEDPGAKKYHLGMICSLATLLYFGSPLANLAHIIRLKSSESLPFPMICMSAVVSFQWSMYGYLLGDVFVMYLNLAGFGLSSIQLLLLYIYPTRGMYKLNKNISIIIPEHKIKIVS